MVVLYIVFILLVLAEVYLVDPYFWNKGKSDKPWSSLLYAFFTLLIFLFEGWEVLFVSFAARAIFDPIMNVSGMLPGGKTHICYHHDKNSYERFWRKLPCWGEMLIRLVWFSSGFILSILLSNWIEGLTVYFRNIFFR